jgi:hypothetical protein
VHNCERCAQDQQSYTFVQNSFYEIKFVQNDGSKYELLVLHVVTLCTYIVLMLVFWIQLDSSTQDIEKCVYLM